MKKNIILLFTVLLIAGTSHLRAQCYGQVHYDASANANGNSTFNIVTANPNELILITFNGWPGPGTGPVTVDGNPATHINTALVSNSSCAEAYCYSAPLAGTHSIVCTENGYCCTCYLNFAAAFYVTGTCTPLSCNSIRNVENATVNNNLSTTITTTTPNEMIYGSFVCNTGIFNPYAMVVTGSTVLGTVHTWDGIDGSDGYTNAPTIGTYTVTTSDVNSCCGEGTVLVAIVPPLCSGGDLAAVVNQVNPTCNSCNGVINIAVSGGNSPYTYSWSPNLSTSASATGLCPGTYTCVARDAACHDTTIVVTLPANILGLTTNVIANVTCFGLSNGSATCSVSGGTPPYTYSWTPTGGNNATASDLSAGTYTITVKDINGCTNSAAVTITEPPQLTAGTQVSNVLCYGGNSGSSTAIPGGGTSPYSYLWSPNGQTGPTASNLSAGTYIVEVRDNNGCTVTASSILTQPTQLMVALSGPQVICAGMSGTLTATATGGTTSYTYNWTWINGGAASGPSPVVKPTSNTIYTCTATDANGCTVSSSIQVDLGPPLVASASGPNSNCAGNPVALCGHVSGGTGGYTFIWQPGNLSGRCITVYPTTTTTYSLMVGDNCGGDTTVTKTVFVNPLPDVTFQSNLQQGCSPLCVKYSDLSAVVGGADVAWYWDFGNGDSSNTQNPVFCYTKPGNYPVNLTVTSDSGCSSSLNMLNYISVYSHPVTNFTASPQPTTILTPDIQFKDETTDQYGIAYWFWNFGDPTPQPKNQGKGWTSNMEDPSHTYSDTGTYCIQLVAMNMHGCTDTTTDCLVIDPIFNFYIPSGFTPNGDGVNDVFQVKGSYIKSFEMYIFDRWGMQLFHSTDINNGWNGTVKGGSTIVQEDTYIYQIYATDSQNKTHSYVGQVSLIK